MHIIPVMASIESSDGNSPDEGGVAYRPMRHMWSMRLQQHAFCTVDNILNRNAVRASMIPYRPARRFLPSLFAIAQI
jgi:hypothetical protein